ncbi:ankyrin repeat-containing domain protein [Podospora conica]|nr:ankyrin repeat-containing domain protein [Schizothecium conicum]
MAEIAGLILTVLPAVFRAAAGIQDLLDHYNNAPEYVQRLQTQCAQTRQLLAGMRDADAVKPKEAHPLFHRIVDDFDKGLETLLRKLKSLNLGIEDGAGSMARIRAILSRQEMMDMRQYILERNAQIQNALLYLDIQKQSERYARLCRDIPRKERERQEALFEALRCGDDDWATKLIHNRTPTGPYTCAPLPDGFPRTTTPLHVAARYGRNVVIKLLLRYQADINARDLTGRTPLMVAVSSEQRGTTKLLVEKGASVNDADNDGATPLHLAISHDSIEATQYLLSVGADANAADTFGDTPLTAVLKRETWPASDPSTTRTSFITALLLHHADPTVGPPTVYHPLHRAAADGLLPELTLLADATPPSRLDKTTESGPARGLYAPTALWLAARNGHRPAVALLLSKGADPSARCQHPQFPTPLWAAYANRDRGTAELLLRHGADPDGAGEGGRTILHHAWERESEAWTELLLSGGGRERWRPADPCREDGDGYQPVHWAVRSNRVGVVELLKRGGACLDVRDRKEGLTPLMMALRPGVNTPMVMRLLNLGADWDARDAEGRDAFFHAVGVGDLMAAGYLLAKGGGVQLRDTSVLRQAIRGKDLEAVRWLVLHGAEVDEALKDFAARYGQDESGQNEMLQFISKCNAVDWAKLPTWKSELAVPVPWEMRKKRASVRAPTMDVQKSERKDSVSTESSGIAPVSLSEEEI